MLTDHQQFLLYYYVICTETPGTGTILLQRSYDTNLYEIKSFDNNYCS